MANYAIMRFKKLKTKNEIMGALKHAFREIHTPNADTSVQNMRFNNMPKSADEAYRRHEAMLPEKYRKDAVKCLEFMVTASDVKSLPQDQQMAYFRKALQYISARCGGRENVIHAEIHLDETEPHLTLFITPKNEFGRLSGAEMVGKGPKAVREFQTEFYEKVAKEFGFQRGIIKDKPRQHEELRDYMSKVNKLENEVYSLRVENAELKNRLQRYEPKPTNTFKPF